MDFYRKFKMINCEYWLRSPALILFWCTVLRAILFKINKHELQRQTERKGASEETLMGELWRTGKVIFSVPAQRRTFWHNVLHDDFIRLWYKSGNTTEKTDV